MLVIKMLYGYADVLKRYGSAYQIKRASDSGKLFKVARGLYSDAQYHSSNAAICALYPKAVLTMDSAFYLHDLTDAVPLAVHVAVPRNSTRINSRVKICIGTCAYEADVKQYFMKPSLMKVGVAQKKVNGEVLRVFSRERMLVELLRKAASMPFDYYKEIVASYRRIIDKLDIRQIEDCVALYSPKYAEAIFEKLQLEVF